MHDEKLLSGTSPIVEEFEGEIKSYIKEDNASILGPR